MRLVLPEEFLVRIREMLGCDFEDFLGSFETESKRGIRINSLKTTAKKMQEQAPFHMEPVPWVQGGFFVDRDADPAGHPFYRAGLYYIQEPSAMTPADRLLIAPGDKVLDLCAAPGGKATALAAKLAGTGLLVANDAVTARCRALLHNLELFGAGNIVVTNEQPVRLAERFPLFFDKILVDAPCSGEGMFNKEPAVIGTWSPERVIYFAAQQRSILRSAVRMLKPGGLLMYSTCTFSKEENEGSVSDLLAACPEMRLCEIAPYEGFSPGRPEWGDGNPSLTKTVRIWPHKMAGAGHFLALMEKEESGDAAAGPAGEERVRDGRPGKKEKSGPKKGGKPPKSYGPKKQQKGAAAFTKEEQTLLKDFLEAMRLPELPGRLENRDGRVFCVPEDWPEPEGLRLIRCGLYLGELKKKRFEPSQAMALYTGAERFAPCLDLALTDPRLASYLAGADILLSETETETENGLVLVRAAGFPVGFGKKTGSTLKNKYLRLK